VPCEDVAPLPWAEDSIDVALNRHSAMDIAEVTHVLAPGGTLLTEQVAILEGYLPAQVTGEELEAVVARVLEAEGITEKREMGRAIGLVSAECGGNCDKAEVARVVGGRLR